MIHAFYICPACRTQSLVDKSNELACSSCNKTYAIQNGIVFLFDSLSPAALAEQAAAETELAETNATEFETEEWLSRYLDNERLGADDRTNRLRRVSTENAVLFLDRILGIEKKRILEIGAGNCWLAAYLAKHHDCTAVDICVNGPRGLRSGDVFLKHHSISFERVVADMINLPFANESFDAVIFCAALHHSSDVQKTVAEAHRVVRHGGSLLLTSEPSVGIFGSHERERVQEDLQAGFNEGRYSARQWKEFLTQAGFSVSVRLPENMIRVLGTSSRGRRLVSTVLKSLPASLRRLFLAVMAPAILRLFDGFINLEGKKKAA